MYSVRSRLLVIFVFISLIPLLFMSIFSYNLSSKVIKDKTGKEVLNSLEQIGKNTDVKMNEVKKYLNTFISSERIKEIIKRGKFDKADYEIVTDWKEINDILGNILYEDNLVRSLYIYNKEKCVYAYGDEFLDTEEFKKGPSYKNAIDAQGSLVRDAFVRNTNTFNKNSKPENLMVFGRALRDTSYADNVCFGSVFIFVDEKVFSDIYIIKDTSQNSNIFIAEGNGRIISHSDKEKINENLYSDPVYNHVFDNDDSNYYVTDIDKVKTIVAYYTLKEWNLKIIETIPVKEYTGEVRELFLITAILAVFLFFSLLAISIIISKRITLPIKELKAAMKKLHNGDFNVRIKAKNRDEFGDINSSFNYMAEKLGELIEKLLSEERLRSEAELDMLQYQINPHFLYNILSSIRFSSISSGDVRTADMLQVLARLLKRTLGNAGKLVPMETEFMNLKDFIFIQQLQYNNKIIVEYNLEDNIWEYMIPNLLLQPIVENAIFHGFDRNMDNPTIRITGKKEEEKIVFCIHDNGKGMSEDKIKEIYLDEDKIQRGFTNIGMANVRRRLQLNFGEQYGLKIESKLGEGTMILVNLPAIFEEGN